MKYKVNVNECWYGNNVSNEKLVSKIIKADNVYDLIEKIKVDEEISEYVYSDEDMIEWHGDRLDYDKIIDEDFMGNCFYLLLNEEVEFECELLK